MSLFRSIRLLSVFVFVALALSGCGGGDALYPVSGKVTVDGKPLPDARLTFMADKDKGNTTTATPIGKVKDGSYSLTTNRSTGAPAGWYNVMVLSQYPGGPKNSVILPRRYSDPGRSHLSVEVVAQPAAGAYDLKLSSR